MNICLLCLLTYIKTYILTTVFFIIILKLKVSPTIQCKAKLLWIMYVSLISQLFPNPIILFHFRPLGSSYIHYAESSMKNGFGLKYLHRFFNIPFLQLQVRGNSQSHVWMFGQRLDGFSVISSGIFTYLTWGFEFIRMFWWYKSLWITARALDADPGDLPSPSNRSSVVFRAASSFASILKSMQAKNKCVLNHSALKIVC